MSDHQASRTLVKSAPELWAECSDAASLARHLGAFGEIRITKLEPETAVAWEGDAARGTVRLEPSGWGTRVILTAQDAPPADPELDSDTNSDPEPDPELESEPGSATEPDSQIESAPDPEPPALKLVHEQRPGLFGRILLRWRHEPPAAPPAAAATAAEEQEVVEEAVVKQPASEPVAPPSEVLRAALDSLGSAHHRPYSRA